MDRAAIYKEFRMYRTDMNTKLAWLQTSCENTTKHVKQEVKDRSRLLLSNKSVKVQLRDGPDHSDTITNLQYKLDSAFGKEHRSPKVLESLQSLSDTIRTIVDSFYQRLLNITKRIRKKVMDGSGVLLNSFLRDAQNVCRKQRDTIALTFKTDL